MGEIVSKPPSIASPPKSPAKTPPMALAKNHKPNIWPIYLLGPYFEKAESPIGDKLKVDNQPLPAIDNSSNNEESNNVSK